MKTTTIPGIKSYDELQKKFQEMTPGELRKLGIIKWSEPVTAMAYDHKPGTPYEGNYIHDT